ncbi:DGQHR domain-containing protein [Rhizobium rhizogenes]|uniref:DGQHR domain-containing protein n=1 Tax=Rhizobium rhizogenes TaxID=359 RepID=UPI001572EC5B|nr:DGQHR domain-containing protein [Rhizobium rhizogenes]NTF72602.1 DGQHR domain-containing protein [Rhizobium rhizogenes]
MVTESLRSVTISALRIRQPIGDIYVGSIPAKTLVDITDFDIRQLVSERGIDSYLGIQRDLDPKRVREIAQYVKGTDATFPTAVVLAVPEKCVTIESPCSADDRFVRMTLSNYPQGEDDPEEAVYYRHIARVIDGQHRIRGLEGYAGTDFDVNVSIFIDADIADQASIFATVNLAQTKVSKSLVYDLFELSKSRSPEKTCHSVVVALESTKGSPLYRKIKRLGKATPGRYSETLSQATVVAGVLQYICKDKIQIIQDRQIGRRGGTFPPAQPVDANKLVLRPFFTEGRDADLTNLIWNFFEAVQERWPDAWDVNANGNMLNRTNGFDGLMRYFRHAYRYISSPGKVATAGQFKALLDKSELEDDDFNPQNFIPGSSGASALARRLIDETGVSST